MTVPYAKTIRTTDPQFKNRQTQILTSGPPVRIPIPDRVVLCNGCNVNLHETTQTAWMIYLDEDDFANGRPYDVYCDTCITRYFADAKRIVIDNEY